MRLRETEIDCQTESKWPLQCFLAPTLNLSPWSWCSYDETTDYVMNMGMNKSEPLCNYFKIHTSHEMKFDDRSVFFLG